MSRPSFSTLIILGVALGILGYALPWAQHAGAGLSLNAYDLAGWSVRHIAEFQVTPVMITSFLLRGQLLIFAALAIPVTGRNSWWLALLFFIALLPPPDGLLREPGNPSHRQLLVLALATAAVSYLGFRLQERWRAPWILLWASMGIASSVLAMVRIIALYDSLKLSVLPGPGFALLLLAHVLLALTALFQIRRGVQQSARVTLLVPYAR